jgi:endonuclease YncB( thermonuclease family)
MRRIFSLLILFCLCGPAYPQTYEGKVIGVSDGDTITILIGGRTQLKVRLAEIDAPEKSQAFGQRSKQSLSDLVFGKQVKVEQQDWDRYGRVVGRVYADGLDVNAEQVKRGTAWVYRKYAHDQALFALEQEAKNNKRSLWADPHAIPPWEYRHGGKPASRNALSVESKQALGKQAQTSSGSHQCGAKRYCGDMVSCEEARLYLTHCGLNKLDRDGDGVPCEALCE